MNRLNSYTYDPRNRMTSANGVSYTLNGLGQRIKKQGGPTGAGAGDADGDNSYSPVGWADEESPTSRRRR